MPESELQMILLLLQIAVGLLLLLLLLGFGIRGRLARIERRLLGAVPVPDGGESAPSPAETSSGGAFEMFLGEDPSRRSLSKGEQFAEYRKWRQEKGLNWSNLGEQRDTGGRRE